MHRTMLFVSIPVLLPAVLAGCSRDHDRAAAKPGAVVATTSPVAAPPAGAPFASGSRLRARLRDGGAGAVALLGWKDTTLGVSCAYQATQDGKTRCIPTSDDVLGYSDQACTQRVVAKGPCSAGTAYVVDSAPATQCGATPTITVYKAGAPAPSGHIRFKQEDGTCVDGGDAGALFKPIEVPLTEFAVATATREPRGASVLVDVLHGEDGSMQIGATYDAGAGRDCTPVPLDKDHTECVAGIGGAWQGPFSSFSDPACSKPLAALAADACGQPAIIAQLGGDACNPTQSLYSVGAAAGTGTTYQLSAQGQCQAATSTPSAGAPLYRLTPIPSGQHPALVKAKAGTGRLRATYLTAPTGEQVSVPTGFHDTTLGRDCVAVSFGGGHVYCVPVDLAPAPSGLFSDAGCTKALVPAPAAGCGTPLTVVQLAPTAPPSAPTCPLDVYQGGSLYSLGSTYAGTQVYGSFNGGACQQMPSPGGLRSIGAPVQPAANFAELVDKVE